MHLTIEGEPDDLGMVLEFGEVKKVFREWLDSKMDHHMLLNATDPLVVQLPKQTAIDWGVVTIKTDPTVENVARLIYEWARKQWGSGFKYHVLLFEAATNAAEYGDL